MTSSMTLGRRREKNNWIALTLCHELIEPRVYSVARKETRRSTNTNREPRPGPFLSKMDLGANRSARADPVFFLFLFFQDRDFFCVDCFRICFKDFFFLL